MIIPAYWFVSVMFLENVQFVHIRGVAVPVAGTVNGTATNERSPSEGKLSGNICLDRAETM